MDEMLIRVMTRLVRIYDELGEESFHNAANRALVSIARSVQLDAEGKAGLKGPSLGDGVVPFPLPSSRASTGNGSAA
jgi:hypothetical protein